MSLGYFLSQVIDAFTPPKKHVDTWGVVPPGEKTYDEFPYDRDEAKRAGKEAADAVMASIKNIHLEGARPHSPQQRPQPQQRAARNTPASEPSAGSAAQKKEEEAQARRFRMLQGAARANQQKGKHTHRIKCGSNDIINEAIKIFTDFFRRIHGSNFRCKVEHLPVTQENTPNGLSPRHRAIIHYEILADLDEDKKMAIEHVLSMEIPKKQKSSDGTFTTEKRRVGKSPTQSNMPQNTSENVRSTDSPRSMHNKVTKDYDSFHLVYAPYMEPKDIRESPSGLYRTGHHLETRTNQTYSEREEAIELLVGCLESVGNICRIIRVQRFPRDHRGYVAEIEYEIYGPESDNVRNTDSSRAAHNTSAGAANASQRAENSHKQTQGTQSNSNNDFMGAIIGGEHLWDDFLHPELF